MYKTETYTAVVPVEDYIEAVSYTHLDVYKRQHLGVMYMLQGQITQ